ncbi:STAS domain-containing protein [Lysobacter pythonis]|uniref:STAS domain-containing protein n=1 Tax=Solilutibacter pythonis TaxID=2483112 RepID=A0A3M2HMG5_9GAMM|nr:STAS domain-containing protein [Lysobacter pythonis]RMH90906.1 STAS domain-containing protein [Lysobacter pythonis]
MPNTETHTLIRHGDALVFGGALTRPVVASAWREALTLLPGAARLDITALAAIDSAGLALLSALSTRAGGLAIDGLPPGFTELRDAYRLDSRLTCAIG